MGFFDKITNTAFKDNQDGSSIYYPNGVLTKGRLVTDVELKNKIYTFHKRTIKYGTPLAMCYGVILGLSGVTFTDILILLTFILVLIIRQRTLISSCNVVNSKLKLLDTLQKAVSVFPKWYYWITGFTSTSILPLMAFFIYLSDESSKPLDPFLYVFPIVLACFGICISYYGYKWKKAYLNKSSS